MFFRSCGCFLTAVVGSLFLLLLFGILLISLVTVRPPAPAITYGEFPFTIVYEANNEIITYTDVIICEYEGLIDWAAFVKKRSWSTRLKSGNEYIVLLQASTNETSFEIYTGIPVLPEYFMGDFQRSKEEYESMLNQEGRYLGYKQNGIFVGTITGDEAWEKYGVRIISIECAPPIENKFE